MKTVQQVLDLTISYLEDNNINHPRRHAEEILAAALDMKRLDIYMNFDRPLSDEELKHCRATLTRCGKGEPIAHIRGSVEFYGTTIAVNSDVLIPRPETELLVDAIAKIIENEDLEGKTLIDMCCGSGCIGIALKKKFPKLDVILSDKEPKALEMAKKNAANNDVAVALCEGDLTEALGDIKADYLVCNPPYVTEEEYNNLDRGVRDYEPKSALVAGRTGLEYYERLEQELPNILKPKALIWLEIGAGQGKHLENIFGSTKWHGAISSKDLSGNDRFFTAQKA